MHAWRPVAPLALGFGSRLGEFASDYVGDRFPELQERLTEDTGVVLPDLDLLVDDRLNPTAYQLLVHDEIVATGDIGSYPLDVFCAAIVTHLEQTLRRNAYQLLTLQQIHQRAQEHTMLLELLLKDISWSGIRFVLVELARERVSLRNLPRILELLLEQLLHSRDLNIVLKLLRERLAGTICRPLERNDKLAVVMLADQTQQALQEGADFGTLLQDKLHAHLATLRSRGLPEVLLTEAGLRKQIRRVTEYRMPELHVLSYLEIRHGLDVVSVGILETNG